MFDRVLNAPLEGVGYFIFLQVKDSYFSYLVDIVFDGHIILDYDNSNSTFLFYGFSPTTHGQWQKHNFICDLKRIVVLKNFHQIFTKTSEIGFFMNIFIDFLWIFLHKHSVKTLQQAHHHYPEIIPITCFDLTSVISVINSFYSNIVSTRLRYLFFNLSVNMGIVLLAPSTFRISPFLLEEDVVRNFCNMEKRCKVIGNSKFQRIYSVRQNEFASNRKCDICFEK